MPVLQDVLSSTRRMCYLGGAMRSSGPQHTFVPCLATHPLASLTLTMDTAQHSRSPARHRARSPQVQPPLHAALDHPPLRTRLPLGGRLAPRLRGGTDQSVVFVEAQRNRDINIKSDFSLSNALSVSMGVGKDANPPSRPGCPHPSHPGPGVPESNRTKITENGSASAASFPALKLGSL